MSTPLLKRFSIALLVLAAWGCSSTSPRVHVVSIYQPRDGQSVRVIVRDTKGPVVLALSSSAPAVWAIEIAPEAKLSEVILQGGPEGPSRVLVPAAVPVWSEIFGSASEVGDHGYRLARHYVKERYGVEPASFQIEYYGREFDINGAQP